MEKILNLAIIASGSGTTANVIIDTCRSRRELGIEPAILIATEEGAGCIERAIVYNVPYEVIDFKTFVHEWTFNLKVRECLLAHKVDFIITAGCKRRILLSKELDYMRMWNTHPADTKKHGGWHMHGLAVHEHVLRDVLDQLWRAMIKIGDPIKTTINFHEIIGGEYDTGPPLLQIHVPIPWQIIVKLLGNMNISQAMKQLGSGELSLEEAAKELQQHVLQFEYRMLPSAINLAAHLVRLEREGMR